MGRADELGGVLEDLRRALEYISTGVTEVPLEGKVFRALRAGDPGAGVVFVSVTDGKGPFDGAEGELLSKMIKAMGLGTDEAYVVYAAASEDGEGGAEKVLSMELSPLKPKAIVALGARASGALLGSPDVQRIRGRFHDRGGVKVMPTFDPESLLREPSLKGKAWEDLKIVMRELGRGAL